MSYATRYTLIGAAFGLCFPVLASLLDAWLLFEEISLRALIQSQSQNPLLWMIDTAPFFLGFFACFAGVQYDRAMKSQREKESLSQLLAQENILLESKVKERAIELESYVNELIAADKFRSDFIATMSHELRTPLTAISGAVKLLKSNLLGNIDQSSMKLVEVADRNTARLISLVNDILDIEGIEEKKHSLALSSVSVASVVKDSVVQNQAYAQSLNTILRFEGADTTKKIKVDVKRFMQVLSNLISNACKFSPSGSEVKVVVTEKAANIRVSIFDKGAGIPPGLETKIFEKFIQADSSSSRSQGGAGLGLYIAKLLVESMGGVIGFHPNEDTGTVFFVEFCAS
ncbi:MAG TPA: HAMP domain-containing histidine kinase [Gammaproteobacteria bacterium]|nr:HAMP domain-containing histidine kinase [Gammaproteobacteria bacterium]